jgi:hypothetical protein
LLNFGGRNRGEGVTNPAIIALRKDTMAKVASANGLWYYVAAVCFGCGWQGENMLLVFCIFAHFINFSGEYYENNRLWMTNILKRTPQKTNFSAGNALGGI